ncbi:MAG: flavodoxin [Candidatus Omnitrophica bacterium]|nr:flavodoxin [Candidatus Omnitrophota bacterium]
MAKAIVVYGSTTGNTETLSKSVGEGLKDSGVEVLVKNAARVTSEELKDYDGIILGCSTWGDGELQDDFISFEEEMGKISLEGKKAACFGPGDSAYPQFCKAVDVLENKMKECGAEIVIDSLKIDGDVESELEKVKDWGKRIGQMIE